MLPALCMNVHKEACIYYPSYDQIHKNNKWNTRILPDRCVFVTDECQWSAQFLNSIFYPCKHNYRATISRFLTQ